MDAAECTIGTRVEYDVYGHDKTKVLFIIAATIIEAAHTIPNPPVGPTEVVTIKYDKNKAFGIRSGQVDNIKPENLRKQFALNARVAFKTNPNFSGVIEKIHPNSLVLDKPATLYFVKWDGDPNSFPKMWGCEVHGKNYGYVASELEEIKVIPAAMRIPAGASYGTGAVVEIHAGRKIKFVPGIDKANDSYIVIFGNGRGCSGRVATIDEARTVAETGARN